MLVHAPSEDKAADCESSFTYWIVWKAGLQVSGWKWREADQRNLRIAQKKETPVRLHIHQKSSNLDNGWN
jgi:hypothetical protein